MDLGNPIRSVIPSAHGDVLAVLARTDRPLTGRRVAALTDGREFLDAAELSLDSELFNAATSSAVTSGVNAKDAVCLAMTGQTAKTDDHGHAVSELRQAGAAAKPLATPLGRLLRLRNRSQYQTIDVARADAAEAVRWATTLVDGASLIVPRSR